MEKRAHGRRVIVPGERRHHGAGLEIPQFLLASGGPFARLGPILNYYVSFNRLSFAAFSSCLRTMLRPCSIEINGSIGTTSIRNNGCSLLRLYGSKCLMYMYDPGHWWDGWCNF